MNEYKEARRIIQDNNEHIIDMSNVCELAHELTINELGDKAERFIRTGDGTEVRYSKKGQEAFDKYYKIITRAFNI